MLENRVIKPSHSPWGAGNSWFSTLDCCSGYWQVELAEKDKHKTAFATRKGLFQFKVMPFGLCCAAQTFERLMETVLAGLQWEVCAAIMHQLLNVLTEKGKRFEWISDCQHAFDLLKIKLTNAPILTHPDFNKEFILDTDASNVALGGVLSQRHEDGKEKVIAYASRSMSKSERRYCVTRKELLAVVYFVKYFKPYLYGRKFTIRTDHSSLRWLLNFKNPEGQVARWIETLSAYDMHIQHRPGTQHRNADALSRIPCKQCGYTLDWQSKTSSDCHKTEESQVKIVTSQMPDHVTDLTLTDIQSNDPDLKLVKQWLTDGQRPLYNEVSGKQEKSPKLTCFWRGPFTILEKSGDLTYKVDCGIRGTPQIIHVDRIKLKHKQVLRGEMYEDIDNPQVTEPREIDIFDNVIDQDDRIEIEEESGSRERKRPVWMADYILD
ncbi:unnamed protein product [Mytilus coruscus]|uniref:Uncharacterized protein n=1 Tax=Mytilus coruscus TaxID=42192 RepID=A0A6J8BSK7_MYTCO|nr:unnamed protein product [Mytilus coruscus]